jgi:glycosyltransferase involved in cell wall biosynthesis
MDSTSLTDLPLISVITVTYNAEEFLEESLDSIVKQSNVDYELIVIDGGSKDKTVDIIKKYENSIAYWHTKTDRGLTHAFNLGIQNSKGQWVIFINADDQLIDLSILSKVSPILKLNSLVDVVYGCVLVVSRNDKNIIIGGPYGKNFSWLSHLFANQIPHQGAFINRNYFNIHGLYDESYLIGADYELFLRKKNHLKTIFIPLKISLMRDGGVSRLNQFLCNKEWHYARLKNKVLPVFFINRLYFFIKMKMFIGLIFRYFNKKFN